MAKMATFDILTVAARLFSPTPHVREKSRVSGIWRILHLLALVRRLFWFLTTRVVVTIFRPGALAGWVFGGRGRFLAHFWGQNGLMGHFAAFLRPLGALVRQIGPGGPIWLRALVAAVGRA